MYVYIYSLHATEDPVWLIAMTGAVLCLLAAPQVQLFADAGNEWQHSSVLKQL